MFKAFVDDSGNDQNDVALILACWVARCDVWERFSDEWAIALAEDRPIKYFKNSEAMARKNCFEGFSADQIESKFRRLIKVIAEFPLVGYISFVKHGDFQRIIQAKAPRVKDRLAPRLTDPFYMGFHDIIPCVLQHHRQLGIEDEVDFVFDAPKGSSPTGRAIAMLDQLPDFVDESLSRLMGTVIPGDDKKLLPLQAADLLAGQFRINVRDGVVTGALRDMGLYNQISIHHIDEQRLQIFSDRLNAWWDSIEWE